MDKKIIENISKVPFLIEKIETVEKLLKKENYVESYKAVAALIEVVCMLTLGKVYDEKVEDSNIVILGSIFDKHHEKEIKDLLVEINGEYNYTNLEELKEIDVISLLSNLDNLVKIVIEKYGNIL